MKLRLAFICLALVLGSSIIYNASAAPAPRSGALRDAEELAPSSELPDPLMMLDGKRVETKKQWLKKRRPELKSLFQHYMYGKMPQAPWKLHATVERVDRTVW